MFFLELSINHCLFNSQNDVKDKLTAILALMNYTLIDPVPLPADPAPILDQYIPTSHTAKVPFNPQKVKSIKKISQLQFILDNSVFVINVWNRSA